MVELRLTRNVDYYDGDRGVHHDGEGVYDVPSEHADEYLNDPRGLWEKVESDTEDSASDESDGTSDDTAQTSVSEVADEPSDDELREFLDGSINSDIMPALRAGEYSDSLARLEEIERSKDDPRSTVLDKLASLQGE